MQTAHPLQLRYLKKNPEKSDIKYFVPRLWTDGTSEESIIETNYNTFFTEGIEKILKNKKKSVNYNQSLSKVNK